jgi:hypothetical protein
LLFDYFADLNWLAVLVAALAYFVLGAIWYSNMMFGKAYRAALGITEQGTPNPSLLVINFVGWFITATALGLVGAAAGASSEILAPDRPTATTNTRVPTQSGMQFRSQLPLTMELSKSRGWLLPGLKAARPG